MYSGYASRQSAEPLPISAKMYTGKRSFFQGGPSSSATFRRSKSQRVKGSYPRTVPRGAAEPLPERLRGFVRTSGAYGRSLPRSGELKYFDSTVVGTISTTGAILTSANLIPQGTGENQRIGRTVTVKSIQMKGIFTQPPSDDLFNDYVQLALVQDTQANGTQPAYADVYTAANNINSMLNLDNSQRFKVLKVWRFPLEAKTFNSTSNNWAETKKGVSFYKRVNIPITFSGTTGVITEVRSNNLCWALIGNSVNNANLYDMTIRLRFDDS